MPGQEREDPENIDANIQKAIKEQAERLRHGKAVTIILQGIKYILGYLTDYGYEVQPDFTQDPIVVTLKIYWSKEQGQWARSPEVVKEKIEKLERELTAIIQRVPNPEISQTVH